MSDPKAPQGSPPEPTPQPPRAEQPTTPLPATGAPARPEPAAGTPAPPRPTAGLPPSGASTPAEPQPAATTPPQAPAEPVTTASAAEAPPGPAGPPPVHATAPRRGFRQVAAHRGTQLVAVGVLGLIVGGGLVALLDHDGYRGGHGRHGISRMDDRGGPPAPGPRHGWDDRGRFER